jgi:crotonobetainyl-CoA:carnitine CoA-transferase CaiB-like acyl-CoA transferase
VDVITGLFATVGILAAVEHRHESGEGQRVEVDLLTSLLAALVNQAAAQTVAGVVPERLGNAHPSIAPYAVFRCADGELALAVGNDRQFESLCAVLGCSEVAADAAYRSNADRVTHADSLRVVLEARLALRGVEEWTELLAAAGVPAGPVNDIAGAIALAQRLGLDPVSSVPRPDGSSIDLVRNPIGLSATPATYRSAPPALGADTQRVLRQRIWTSGPAYPPPS